MKWNYCCACAISYQSFLQKSTFLALIVVSLSFFFKFFSVLELKWSYVQRSWYVIGFQANTNSSKQEINVWCSVCMLAKKWSCAGWFIFQLVSLVLNVRYWSHTQNLCVRFQYLASIRIYNFCGRHTHARTNARTYNRCHFYELFISLWMKNVFCSNIIWCVQHAKKSE